MDKTLETYLEYPMTIESKDYIIKSMKYKWKYINGLIADLNLEMQYLGLTQIEPAIVKKVIPRIGTVNFLNLLYNSLLGKNNSKELKRLSNYRNASKYLFNSYYNLLQELIKLKHDIYKGEVDFTTRVKYQSTNRWSDIKTEKLWNLATSLDLPFEVLYSYKHKLLEYKDTEDGLLKFLITT